MIRSKPEEEVRQRLLLCMKEELGFPPEMISVERSLGSLPHLLGQRVPDRRFDIVCFKKHGEEILPLLIVECKAVDLTNKAAMQVIGYNHFARAPFIALANQKTVYTGYYSEDRGYLFEEGLFSYERMGNWKH